MNNTEQSATEAGDKRLVTRLRIHGNPYPEVKGIVVGECKKPYADGRAFHREWAHAHDDPKSDDFGVICVRYWNRLGKYVLFESPIGGFDGEVTKPSTTIMHEVAHVLTQMPGHRHHGHDDVWRAKMRELGQRIGSQYKKRTRKPKDACCTNCGTRIQNSWAWLSKERNDIIRSWYFCMTCHDKGLDRAWWKAKWGGV